MFRAVCTRTQVQGLKESRLTNQRGQRSGPCRLWGGFWQGPLYSLNRLVSQNASLSEWSVQGCKRAKHKTYNPLDDRWIILTTSKVFHYFWTISSITWYFTRLFVCNIICTRFKLRIKKSIIEERFCCFAKVFFSDCFLTGMLCWRMFLWICNINAKNNEINVSITFCNLSGYQKSCIARYIWQTNLRLFYKLSHKLLMTKH